MITHTRNKFITNFTAVTNDGWASQNTYYFMFDDVPLNQNEFEEISLCL